jgi:hypothetical protein
MMRFSAGRMELKEKFVLQKIAYGLASIAITSLIQEDASIIFRIAFWDMLEKESSKPSNRRDFRYSCCTA